MLAMQNKTCIESTKVAKSITKEKFNVKDLKVVKFWLRMQE